MNQGIAGRADLVKALVENDPSFDTLANLLGFVREPEKEAQKAQARSTHSIEQTTSGAIETITSAQDQVFAPVPFWRAESISFHEPTPPPEESQVKERVSDEYQRREVPLIPLASNAEVLTKLRRHGIIERPTHHPDVKRLVDDLSRGRIPDYIPKQFRRVWGSEVEVFVDRSRHLVPYWKDQREVLQGLRRLYPEAGFGVSVCGDGDFPVPSDPLPLVIALSDLGVLAQDEGWSLERWYGSGKAMQNRGILPVAIVPCSLAEFPDEIRAVWEILPWEATSGPPLPEEKRSQAIERILCLLSFTVRVDPVLIRVVRRLLPETRQDPGIESLVWQSPYFTSGHCDAATFDRGMVKELEPERFREPTKVRAEIFRAHRELRQGIYPGVLYAELLGLEKEVQEGLIKQEDWDQAAAWFRQWRAKFIDPTPAGPGDIHAHWFREAFNQLPQQAMQKSSVSQELNAFWKLVKLPESKPPSTMRPRDMGDQNLPERTLAVLLDREKVVIAEQNELTIGSPLSLLRTRNGQIKLDLIKEDPFWQGKPPYWAKQWGKDKFGHWVEFEVNSVKQRMRWIPPGEFTMGSPEDEDGYMDYEGPQHHQRIKRGFWIFDTPCTQELWVAVMGENPSHFSGPKRPVEQVSWDMAQEFIGKLNELLPEMELSLPPEAQWEYACRAGTEGPAYEDNLKEIAWFSDNSNSETKDVAQKKANKWGLFDILGNVWEWCQDNWRANYNAEPTEPTSARRVIRGGSWLSNARSVRAACRGRSEPDGRYDLLGFRCVEFRSPGPASLVERAVSESERRAEPRGDREPASGARWLDLAKNKQDAMDIPPADRFHIESDLETISIEVSDRPSWASTMGRDQFGLWSEVEPFGVKVRLRWIPPGRFLMGSPEKEEGRIANEGPQHEATIPVGFWMFETPCTQELWQAVMGNNPSRFVSSTRPVEKISWDDCSQFLSKINEQLEGLNLALPTELQWEYVCRAGTTSATYTGVLKILGENNAPVLDEIAWYGGNCGVDFEQDGGENVDFLSNKQYEFTQGGTHSVGKKKANKWGLFDMLGNVWEWCQDDWRENYNKEPTSAGRVIRGGSWSGVARNVRAACRSGLGPDYRSSILGFRCVEFRPEFKPVRAVSESERLAEPRGDRSPRAARKTRKK